MVKIKPTPQLIVDIIIRVPEGFLSLDSLPKWLGTRKKSRACANRAAQEGQVGRHAGLIYDPARVSAEQVTALSTWCHPELPPVSREGKFLTAPIAERIAEREHRLDKMDAPALKELMVLVRQTDGYVEADEIRQRDQDESLQALLQMKMLKKLVDFIYDPLRLSRRTIVKLDEHRRLAVLHGKITQWLASHPGSVARQDELSARFGVKSAWPQIEQMGGLVVFDLSYRKNMPIYWVRLAEADAGQSEKIARRALKPLKERFDREQDQLWEPFVALSGDVIRPGAREGDRARSRVIARTYALSKAARRLELRYQTIDAAVRQGTLRVFRDPEGRERIPAEQVEAAALDPALREEIAAYEVLQAKEIAIAGGVSYSTARRWLQRAHLSATRPRWGEVRGRWNLPEHLDEFRRQIEEQTANWWVRRSEAARASEERKRQEREALRARLVAAFPTWRHDGRSRQHIILHMGPTNSGKTFDALNRLSEVGEGWYLAPLRLLAFEVFDTLNARGVLCNLLTGEERIDVPGALLTAATVEMFNPRQSGRCVLIDEAHLLAEPDRGWAWTRALMEAQAPEIHVIGAPIAQGLVERLARAAAVEIDVVEHKRLTPLQVADRPWPLSKLPARTILVAFSRAAVLALKVDLEGMGRTVSVVYGNLPPEVRRNQAARFAGGESEICVATDAVGMGLNLPADQVCFAEVEKFDGREQRLLTPNEIRQIGGRAGRYLYSELGEVGATTQEHLAIVRRLFSREPEPLTHARVAPTVEDIAMIPGHLSERLARWAALESIPDSLRGALKTADMSERIELAGMLRQPEVDMLGLPAAMKLINAPTQQNTRAYWRKCASAILYGEPLPLPPAPNARIAGSDDLQWAETCIRCADIYLWLSGRREFKEFGRDVPRVRRNRVAWSRQIDEALIHKIDAAPRCSMCGRRLPYDHRFRMCERCFAGRRRWWDEEY
ncbi:MAG: hypothetical protein JXB07_19230 [Anaerolineae bacterium]|nr:hypothetical protein [Anaerolineae bacterium]